jgi:hypothetical protein
MATKIARKARQPVKRTNLFYEQTNDFYLKYCCGSLDFLFFVVLCSSSVYAINGNSDSENKVGGKVFLVMIGNH